MRGSPGPGWGCEAVWAWAPALARRASRAAAVVRRVTLASSTPATTSSKAVYRHPLGRRAQVKSEQGAGSSQSALLAAARGRARGAVVGLPEAVADQKGRCGNRVRNFAGPAGEYLAAGIGPGFHRLVAVDQGDSGGDLFGPLARSAAGGPVRRGQPAHGGGFLATPRSTEAASDG